MLKRPAVGANSRIAMINKRFREEEETTAPSPPPSTPRSIDKFVHSKRDELQNTHTHTNETEEKSHGERESARCLMKYLSMATDGDCRSQEFRHNRKRACLLAAARKRRNWTQECDPNASIIARQEDLISSVLVIARRRRGGMPHTEREKICRTFSVTMEKLVFRLRRFFCCVADLSLSL